MELTPSEKRYQEYTIRQFELLHDTQQKLLEKHIGATYEDLLRFNMIQEVHEISTSIDEITRRHFEL